MGHNLDINTDYSKTFQTAQMNMKIFIPTNEPSEKALKQGYCFRPFDINAYSYHFSMAENTQNLFNKNVITGTETTSKGKTCVE